VDVLTDVTGLDKPLIRSMISLGHMVDSPPPSLFKLNVSHFELAELCALIYGVLTLSPRPMQA